MSCYARVGGEEERKERVCLFGGKKGKKKFSFQKSAILDFPSAAVGVLSSLEPLSLKRLLTRSLRPKTRLGRLGSGGGGEESGGSDTD